MKTKISQINTSLVRQFVLPAFTVFVLAFACFTLVPAAQAVSPPPDGGYPGGNTAEGQTALFSLTTGVYNTAVGAFSLRNNTAGSLNTAIGAGALLATTSDENTAIGAGALLSNSTGEGNTATGEFTLSSNADGSNNTANGAFALFSNATGSRNTANGISALYDNTEGISNTAVGAEALTNNTTGADNTAIGDEAMFNSTSGDNNTGIGTAALSVNTIGFSNTAVGHDALGSNMTGSGNSGLGENAGFNVTTASNVICIGSIGGDNIDNSCYIANIYSNIQPVIGTDPDYVTIASNGRLGRSNLNGSSRRFKHDVQSMERASEVIFALKPVSFRYNKEYDPSQRLSFGLIAEEVAETAPDLVGRNKKGEPESVRYEQINAMLLNEFLKEHKKMQQVEAAVAEQCNTFEATIAELKKEIATVAVRSKERDAKIQKVSAGAQRNRAARRAVAKN